MPRAVPRGNTHEFCVQYSLVFFPGLLVGRLFDLGHHLDVALAFTSLLVVATFLTAQCREYWHFLLCQGLAVGVRSFTTDLKLNSDLGR
jgi:hypothetical protein